MLDWSFTKSAGEIYGLYLSWDRSTSLIQRASGLARIDFKLREQEAPAGWYLDEDCLRQSSL
jgi:hypothetical protein